jgi:hypothetical protein
MLELDMRSFLANLVPPVGYEPPYDLTAFVEVDYTQLYTYKKKKFHVLHPEAGAGQARGAEFGITTLLGSLRLNSTHCGNFDRFGLCLSHETCRSFGIVFLKSSAK